MRPDLRTPLWVPQWPTPAGVHARLSMREGGVSVGPYRSLNLGTHVGDLPGSVQANRMRLREWLGVEAVYLDQVHGHAVHVVDHFQDDVPVADASVTRMQRLACTILVADCLPVLLAADGGAVAAAHAGWRGLAAGVLEHTVQALCALAGCGAHAVSAWLGPCIGPAHFEVGEVVRDAFGEGPHLRPLRPGKWLAHLPGLARDRLRDAGVTRLYGNDGSPFWCTVGDPGRYFSYRRDGVTGRFAACVWLDPGVR